MIKVSIENTNGGTPIGFHLNETAESIFHQLFGPGDIKSTKSTLFQLMHGIAESNVALNRLIQNDEINPEAYVSMNINSGLYLVAKLYEMLDNIEFTE